MWQDKYIVNFTPTGMIPTKDLTPFVPITVDEVIEDVLAAAKLGVSMVHLHARDPKTGESTYTKVCSPLSFYGGSQIFRKAAKKFPKYSPHV